MSVKQFLKPNLSKIILWILFCLIFLLIIPSPYQYKYAETFPWHGNFKGLPLIYYSPGGGGCIPRDSLMQCVDMPPGFNFVYLIIDVIFWYLISCLIIWIYDKFKKKLQPNRF